MQINYDPRIFNPLYWHLKDAMNNHDIRIIFLMGGSSSGKSFSTSQAIIIDAQEYGTNTLLMRKYGADIEDSIYSDAKGIGERIAAVTNDFTFIKNKIAVGDGKLRFRGIDKSERIKGISSYKRVYMDELTEFKEDDYKQIKKRLRGKPGQQIIASWNPISRTHWIKKNVIDKEQWEDMPLSLDDAPTVGGINLSELNPEFSFKKINKRGNILFIKNTYRDNFWVNGHPAGDDYGFVDKHVIADFEDDKIKDINNYNVYANGEWGVITDRLIMKNWREVDSIPKEAKRIPSGVDWGFNPDPATVTDFYLLGDTLYWDEVLNEQGLTNIETKNPLQDSIAKRLKESNFKQDHLIIADSAEPKSIREMREEGFNMYAVKKPSISDSLKALLSYNHCITSKSKNIITEFENYVRKIDKDGNILPEPIDDYNHHIDPARYVISMKGRLW